MELTANDRGLGGYVSVLRRNRSYRSIWLGSIVSLTGDWFTTVALFSMLLQFTGRGEAVGYALVARFLPTMLLGPAAGIVADRFHRKRVMIACDLLRAIVVLGFLVVRSKDDVPLAYALTFLQLSISTFFDPAEQAAIGSVVVREDIVTANALHAITWSAVLSFGALLGGLVTAAWGHEVAFVIDSLSFVGSAILIGCADVPRAERKEESMPDALASRISRWLGMDDIAEGVRLVASNPSVARILLAKAGWGLGAGGGLLLYTVFAERVFRVGTNAAAGMGILYGARGLGAVIGPFLARRLRGDGEAWLEQAIGWSFSLAAFAYLGFSLSPAMWAAALALMIGHMGGSTIWVFSNALINLRVRDEMRGRIFAADGSAFTIALSASALFVGHALDTWSIAPRVLMGGLAALLLLPTILWPMLRSKRTVPIGTLT